MVTQDVDVLTNHASENSADLALFYMCSYFHFMFLVWMQMAAQFLVHCAAAVLSRTLMKDVFLD